MFTLYKLIFWFLVWILVRFITLPFKKKEQENCLTWAIRKWEQEDGYLVVRWCRSSSHRFKWPHFLWLPANKHEHLQHVVPDCNKLIKKAIPDPWFDPKLLQGDSIEAPKDN